MGCVGSVQGELSVVRCQWTVRGKSFHRGGTCSRQTQRAQRDLESADALRARASTLSLKERRDDKGGTPATIPYFKRASLINCHSQHQPHGKELSSRAITPASGVSVARDLLLL